MQKVFGDANQYSKYKGFLANCQLFYERSQSRSVLIEIPKQKFYQTWGNKDYL